MKWITCKAEYYSWLVEVLTTKNRATVSKYENVCVFQSFKYCLSFSFETCLTYWWGRTQFSRLIEHTHVHHFKKMCLTAQKNLWAFFGPDLTRVNSAGSFFPKWPGIKSDWGWVCNLRTVRSQILFARSSGINSQTSAPCFVLPLPALSSNWSWSITKKENLCTSKFGQQ